MRLSADELNLRSPYRLAQVNDMTFSFVSDQQIRYNVGFYKDTYFMDDGAYHFFIDNSEHEHGSYDPKILAYYQDFLKHVPELFVPRDK